VTGDLHAPGTLLGVYWMMFGVGAVLGGLAFGGSTPAAPVAGDGRHREPAGAWRCCRSDSTCRWRHGRLLHARRRDLRAVRGALGALMQAKSPPQHLAAMLAARSAALLTASRWARRSADRSRPRWARARHSAARPRHPWRSAPSPAPCYFPGQCQETFE